MGRELKRKKNYVIVALQSSSVMKSVILIRFFFLVRILVWSLNKQILILFAFVSKKKHDDIFGREKEKKVRIKFVKTKTRNSNKTIDKYCEYIFLLPKFNHFEKKNEKKQNLRK